MTASGAQGHEAAAERPIGDLLLLLRAFAGFVVVVIHVYPSLGVTQALDDSLIRIGPLDLSWIFSGAGQAGVYLFFTLSGYLMGKGFANARYPLTARGALSFYWARALRIYPLFIFYIVIMITLGRMNAPNGPSTYGILASMLAMQWQPSFGESFPWFQHLWSIMTEFRFYLLVPLLALVFERVARRRGVAFALLAGFVAFGFFDRWYVWNSLGLGVAPWTTGGLAWETHIQQPLIANMDFFGAGMLLNYVVRPRPLAATARRLGAFLAALSAFYLFTAYVTHYALFTQVDALHVFWALGLPTASLWFTLWAIAHCENLNAGPTTPIPAPLRSFLRAATHLGTLTYGIYVWHLPFIALPLPFSRPFGPFADLLIAIATTYGMAALMAQVTYLGLELPFDRMKRLVPARASGRTVARGHAAFADPATVA